MDRAAGDDEVDERHVSAEDRGGGNVIVGRITAAVFAGDHVMYGIATRDQILQCRADADRALREGDPVYVQLPLARRHLVRRE